MLTEAEKLLRLRELYRLKRDFSLFFYDPYPKQRDFHEMGKTIRERLLMAGNRLGKTYSAGMETAMHSTGIYPEWWTGRRWESPIRAWVGSVTAELCRDGAQRILLGPINRIGTGCIPKDRILDMKRARGVPDAIESVWVKHVTGETSMIVFKSYKDGREAWQADEIDVVWLDEEPPFDVYIEALTRTNNTGGVVYLTFTPLMGMSQVVMRYLNEQSNSRAVVNMTIDDALHYTEEQRREIIAAYPPHEREARAMGQPFMGEGQVFPIAESEILEHPLEILPRHWKRIIGIDFGWDHPTAAVLICHEPEADILHVVTGYKQSSQLPLVHAAAIRAWGPWIPVAWPKDGLMTEKGSGEQLAEIYRKQGLRMLSEYAQYPDDRGNSVEPGLLEMYERMMTGRFKVASSLSAWREEFRMYHRKRNPNSGKIEIAKINDDLMSATRYACMMLRYALAQSVEEVIRDKYARKHRRGGTWMRA